MTGDTRVPRPTTAQTGTARTDPGKADTGTRDRGPDRTRRSLLGGTGMLLGGGAALAAGVGGRAEAAPAEEPMQQGRDADAGRPTRHREAYYRLARF